MKRDILWICIMTIAGCTAYEKLMAQDKPQPLIQMPVEVITQLKSSLDKLNGASAVVEAATKTRDEINAQIGALLTPWCSMVKAELKDCKISPEGRVEKVVQQPSSPVTLTPGGQPSTKK